MAAVLASIPLAFSFLIVSALPVKAARDWDTWCHYIGDPLTFCDKDCILKVFADHCESMECRPTDSTSQAEALQKLCVDTCIRGFASTQMSNCLNTSFPNLNGDPTNFQNLLLHEANGRRVFIYCDLFIYVEYCDGVVVNSSAVGTTVSIPFKDVYPIEQNDD